MEEEEKNKYNHLPNWKISLQQKKDQEKAEMERKAEEERRKQEELEKQWNEKPAWKQEIILRKKSVQN